MRKSYIKNLEFNIVRNFNKWYLTVYYKRGYEHNHITYSNIPDYVTDEKSVRKFLNQ